MCGIAGAIGNFGKPEAEGIVRAMVTALGHRGPDDSGNRSWNYGTNVVNFGHTRLSILDLSSAGHQPMTEQSLRYWTVFNGEIYNFQELRSVLDPENSLFRTGCDTEVILHAYQRWSEESFRAFRGMFAFALLDDQARKIHLVRDPLGIKPLYYYAAGQKLLFASEVQALLESGQVPRRISTKAVSHFLSFGWVGQSETVISGIQLLQPGHVLTVDLSSQTMQYAISRYEPEIPPQGAVANGNRNESTGHILHLLEQSVKCHLVSDVPVGLFLSGGIDSTVLLALMRRAGCKTPKTFTVAFSEQDFSESRFAKQVAETYDAEHHEIHVSESSLFARLPAAFAAMDQPTMDGINTFVIASAVHSAGVKVALSGLGSDELFAGYPTFRRARWARMVARVPASVRKRLANVGRSVRNGLVYDKLWDLLETDCTPLAAYRMSRQLFGVNEISALSHGRMPMLETPHPMFPSDEINEMSRLEMQGYMTGLLLRDTDFMSMANSLEVRVPFVDKELVRYVLQVPGRWKMALSTPKVLLLDSMKGTIPRYVWNRRKMGFTFPFERWMRSSFRTEMEEALSDRKRAEATGLESAAIKELWQNFLAGGVRWSKLWSVFVLLRWCERQRASV
jgi:asparagine synthase (glutamine-hydrolysing)